MMKQITKDNNNTSKQYGLMVLVGGKWVPVEELRRGERA